MLTKRRWPGQWREEGFMNNQISDFKDEVEEVFHETAKIVKKQVTAKPVPQMDQNGQVGQEDQLDPKSNKKIDPVTGKPMPSSKMLTHLNQQVAQLAQMRIKKVREELEKQRLKTRDQVLGSSGQSAQGPDIKQEQTKPKEDIVAKTLKASKSTGEFKGLIGG